MVVVVCQENVCVHQVWRVQSRVRDSHIRQAQIESSPSSIDASASYRFHHIDATVPAKLECPLLPSAP